MNRNLIMSWAILGLLALTITGSTPLQARKSVPKKPTLKESLVQRYYWYEELLANANSEDIIAMQRDEFVNTLSDRTEISREQSDALLRMSVDQVQRVHAVDVRINRMDIGKGYAVVIATQYYDVDKKDPNGQIYRVITNTVARHTWVMTDDGWKIARAQVLRGYGTVDGETFRF